MNYTSYELPTVTVAIPARNETEDLKDCLDSLLSCTYPKLEILVLDDCSQDTTAEVIKNFAHDGVRFISGKEADGDWLPKNWAYQRLLSEASGEYIIFCGVDTRFGRSSIQDLITITLGRKLKMLSVLPLRLTNNTSAAIVQPMRYWWELALPRTILNRPPVLSTCWLVNRKSMQALGGFNAVSRSVLPERYFAREFAKNMSYLFISAQGQVDIQTNKSLHDQKQTALRVRYPQTHKRPELVFFIVIAELLLLVSPFVSVGWGLISGAYTYVFFASLFSCALIVMTHIAIVILSNPANVPLALINLPVVLLTELYLGLVSMIRYEFGTISWKERNICIPVMHVYPKLPKID